MVGRLSCGPCSAWSRTPSRATFHRGALFVIVGTGFVAASPECRWRWARSWLASCSPKPSTARPSSPPSSRSRGFSSASSSSTVGMGLDVRELVRYPVQPACRALGLIGFKDPDRRSGWRASSSCLGRRGSGDGIPSGPRRRVCLCRRRACRCARVVAQQPQASPCANLPYDGAHSAACRSSRSGSPSFPAPRRPSSRLACRRLSPPARRRNRGRLRARRQSDMLAS